jgi:hypothetical protein
MDRGVMVVPQEEIGDVEQGLTCAAIADPGPCIAPDPVVLREAGAQQGNLQAFRARRRVRIGDDQLGSMGQSLAFEILEIADPYRRGGQVGEDLRAT